MKSVCRGSATRGCESVHAQIEKLGLKLSLNDGLRLEQIDAVKVSYSRINHFYGCLLFANVTTKGTSLKDVLKELSTATGRGEVDAVIDCAGAEEMIRIGFSLLSVGRHYSSVG